MSRTALGVAAVRAVETARPDALFRDPLAEALLRSGATGRTPRPPSDLRRVLAQQIVLRTAFFDDHLLAANRAGARQVVLVAAGLDARFFRLAWAPGTVGYELDLPAVLAAKDQAVAGAGVTPTCTRRAVAVDLATDWAPALLAAGFQPDRPAAWLVEGLLVYLGPGPARSLLRTLTALSSGGSTVAFELGAGARALAARAATDEDRALVSLWRGGLGPAGARWLAAQGWEPTVHPLAEVAAAYGRPLGRRSASGLLTARRTRSGGDGDGAAHAGAEHLPSDP